MPYPWLKYDQSFHIGHIFPRAMFTKKRLEKLAVPKDAREAWLEHTDNLANLQLLQGGLSQNMSDKEFEAGLKESNPNPDDLGQHKHLHLIPNCELTFQRFPEFPAERTGIIKRKLEELLCT